MTTEEKLDVINAKLDLLVKVTSCMPLFIKAPHETSMRISWKKAIKEYKKIMKEYTELENHANLHNTAGIKKEIS